MSKSAKKVGEVTPMMKQYNAFKTKYPDALLLFRVGDFYETFGEDAVKASRILGIALTRRSNMELAGVPHHALDTYLPRLVRAGQRVAICEQLEDPKSVKYGHIVKRGVTELVTPGIATNTNVLEHKENNFLACVHIGKTQAGVAFLDISTGEFYVAEGNFEYADRLLTSFAPKEVLFQQEKGDIFVEKFGAKYYTYKLDNWAFAEDAARDKLLQHFQTLSLKGFGIEELQYGTTAAGAMLFYLELTHHHQSKHIAGITRIDETKYMWLDKFTMRNLELLFSQNEKAQTLLGCIDKTISPMGGRLLRRWISLPLRDIAAINMRLDMTALFLKEEEWAEKMAQAIREVGDLERLISRASLGKINPREMILLAQAMRAVDKIKQLCVEVGEPNFARIAEQLNACETLRSRIEQQLDTSPSAQIGKGSVIADGVDAELDELRSIKKGGTEYLLQIQQKESSRTGIPSLKIAFNNIFGYYIEVRNAYKNRVPAEWIRKQTLTDAERYITEEIKRYEETILGADEKITAIEQRIFAELVALLLEYTAAGQYNATLIAQLDCLLSFAKTAKECNYVRPQLNSDGVIDIRQGRHPVIEQLLPPGEKYVANDVYLDRNEQQVIILTGPNMSGKSALLRQTALIVLMAQTGCYVPADQAVISITDKIFTRVGASDNISQGESTFMVEMQEAASILNNLSNDSLILLDEIGRGTSTYDGISIATSMIEYIHEHPAFRAKTIFATHYHELNELANDLPRVKNFNIATREVDNKVIFLRKLQSGSSAHSFGIHVAQMAGMPQSVVERANQILAELEEKSQAKRSARKNALSSSAMQLSFFQLNDPVLEQIVALLKNTELNTLTPIEALNKLNEIKKLI